MKEAKKSITHGRDIAGSLNDERDSMLKNAPEVQVDLLCESHHSEQVEFHDNSKVDLIDKVHSEPPRNDLIKSHQEKIQTDLIKIKEEEPGCCANVRKPRCLVNMTPFVLLIGLGTHAIFEGLALGLQDDL